MQHPFDSDSDSDTDFAQHKTNRQRRRAAIEFFKGRAAAVRFGARFALRKFASSMLPDGGEGA